MTNFALENKRDGFFHVFESIGIWCNGNTTDSGPVILGSSPSIPTTVWASSNEGDAFLFIYIPDKVVEMTFWCDGVKDGIKKGRLLTKASFPKNQ